MPIRSALEKLRDAYERHFTFKAPEDVEISGLGPRDRMFKESLQAEAEAALEKMRRELPIESFKLHVKSTMHGEGKQLFELAGTLLLEDNRELHSKTANKDPLYAFKFLVRDLESEVRRNKSKKDDKPKRKFYK
ncbi:MAG: hypothetical protein WC792_03915 [Candidatus Micrarchaeia archaeon]|jgi:ribosome-associated translation inhibitor RaiA